MIAPDDIDPAAVMAEHRRCEDYPRHTACVVCVVDAGYEAVLADWPCLPYRLAEALVASEAKLADLRRTEETA